MTGGNHGQELDSAAPGRGHRLAPGPCRLPEGTYEREISKEGFFGPSAQMHHTHTPTDWIEFDGAIRPRAFDLNKLDRRQGQPVGRAQPVMSNAASADALWRSSSRWTELARNSDGDELLFIHEGEGALFCDYGHLDFRDGDYIVLPRGTMWRLDAGQAHHGADDRGDQRPLHPAGEGPGRPACDLRSGDARHAGDRRRLQGAAGRAHLEGRRSSARGQLSTVTYPVQPARCGRLARRPERRCASTGATCGR